MATLMGNHAIDPKVLARTIHAWESAFERHRRAGRPVRAEDVEAALRLLRKAEKALRKCVYEKKGTRVREERVQFHCVDCGKPLDLAEFNETVVGRRRPAPLCRVCTKRRAHVAGPPARTQAQQETQAGSDPTEGVS